MADRARCDLPYGHFGRGIYSLDDHCWYFERDLAFSSTTQSLAEPKIISNSSKVFPKIDCRDDRGGPSSTRHSKQIKALTDSDPALRPAAELLLPLVRVSEAAQDALRCHDVLKGNLIALGDIQSQSRHRPITVAAYATGPSGSDLCIVHMQIQKRGWDDDRSSWLQVPSPHGEQAIWSSRRGPIQQIHFADNLQPGPALLAVRLLTRTTIIRAIQVKSPADEAHGSSISPNVLYNVDIEQTGGNTHVDVAFNPWFPQQVAIVDTAGIWTVLEFSARNMSQVARTWSSMAQKTSDDMGTSINDGWARIAWVGDLGTLAVCTRESLTLFSIVEDDPTMVEEVDLGLSGVVPWVLDLLVLPGRRDHFCVLTTTHILVYRLVEKTASRKTASIRFRIRHYKNPEDLSLRLTAWAEEGEEGMVHCHFYHVLSTLTLLRCWSFDVLKHSRADFVLSSYAF